MIAPIPLNLNFIATRKAEPSMNQETAILVSCRPENRKTLVRVLYELSINNYVAPTILDARAVLASQPLSMVFCDERLSDDSYCDLLTDGSDRRIQYMDALPLRVPSCEFLPQKRVTVCRCRYYGGQ